MRGTLKATSAYTMQDIILWNRTIEGEIVKSFTRSSIRR